jgi:hypothetical protein
MRGSEDGSVHFIHLVPFRNCNELTTVALKQINVVDEECNRINEMLRQCLECREVYMELYTKSMLSRLNITLILFFTVMNH